MSNKKKVYYSLKIILGFKALIMLIFGKKSNGKSYQIKHFVLENYLKDETRFIYLRRFKDEITQGRVERYFNDVDVMKLTEGRYNCIVAFRRKIYFGVYDQETCKVQKCEHIGYYMSLSQEQNESSGSFLDVGNIVFEEFMSRTNYLPGEAKKLMYLYSTVDRNRKTTKLFLIGNTITRACPYLISWGLLETIKHIKQGEIRTMKINDGEGNDYNLAIEFCKGDAGGSALMLGDAAENISSGEWYSEPQPKLPGSYNDYEILFRFVIIRQGFRYLCELLTDRQALFWFIRPKKGDIKPKTIVVSDKPNINRMYFLTINDVIMNLGKVNGQIGRIFSTFSESNIFFCDDLTGTEFKQLKGGF